ncbi:MAG: D-tyrosyl-tRNA(Tyr) deacylase [Planctomycetia bacterium TMED53]|nr:MAG: D-tyrosyl-tRNA(Tyr) deacylase [Planctomycetia bacterium TMED53]
MRVLIQRVSSASVEVDEEICGEIARGLLVFVGFGQNSSVEDIAWLANKVSQLRIFPDPEGYMNLSAIDVGGEFLVVSQFTLYGDCRKGRRPSFEPAMAPVDAVKMYHLFVEEMSRVSVAPVQTGIFGADMKVSLVNDGPVTLLLERESGKSV